MKVNPISSYFGKPSTSTSSPQATSPIQVPSRRVKKKVKKPEPPPEDEEMSDHEDPLPRKEREKKKSEKRKARVLSDSDDEEAFVKKKPDKKVDKKTIVVPEKKPVVEKKVERKNVDPKDYFSQAKVKQDKIEKKPVVAEIPPVTKKEKRDDSELDKKVDKSPQKKSSRSSSPQKSPIKDEPPKKQLKVSTPPPAQPSSSSRRSSPQKSPIKDEPPKKQLKVSSPPPAKSSSSSSRRSSPRKSSTRPQVSSDSDSEPDFNPKKKSKPSTSRSSSKSNLTITKKSDKEKEKDPPESKKTPAKKTSKKEKEEKPPPTEEEKKKKSSNYAKFLAHQTAKPRHLGEKRIPIGTKDCLDGLTLVVTGVLDSLERDSCKSLVEKYGARLTTGVSKKTTHLIVGDDPGASKIAKAEQLGIPMISEDGLLEMIRISNPDGNNNDEEVIEMLDLGDAEESPPVHTPEKNKSPKVKVEEKEKSSKDRPKKHTDKTDRSAPLSLPALPPPPPPSLMWVDKYKPKTMKQIVSHGKETGNATKLVRWLNNWFKYHGKANDKAKTNPPGFRDPEGKTYKCALLSGPPGIGKTTTAHLACKEVGYDFFELNASDTRNKKGLHQTVSDALSCKTMYGGINDLTKQHVLIMDEVDGMSGNEDRGGIQELIGLIKTSRVPVICICNDRNHPKIRSLANYCFDLRFNKPTVQELKALVATISFREKLKIDPQRVIQLCISTDMDIRQIIHTLELYKDTNAENVSAPKKDLRFGPWDVCRKVFLKPEHEMMNIHEKTGLFFQDYSIGSLFIQENYLKMIPVKAKQKYSEAIDRHRRLELIARSAAAISLGDVAETMIRKTNNWSLLPVQGIFSSYIPGELMESNLSGNIEFPSWLGKNSNKNKRQRLLQSLHTHVHLQVSASLEALNMDYLPYLRRKICTRLGGDDVTAAAEVMETYSLLRDDVESLNDLCHWPGMKNPLEHVDSKTKAAFTRMVNKEVLPYASDKGVKKGRKAATDVEGYGEEEEEVGIVSEEDEDADKVEKDAMIKMKKSGGRKKAAVSESPAKSSNKKKGRK